MRRRSAVAAAILMLLASACGGEGPRRRFGIKTLLTDILFGSKDREQAAGQTGSPAPVDTPAAPRPYAPLPTLLAEEPREPARAESCPAASATSFPAQIAGPEVASTPEPGRYRWVASGHRDLTVDDVTLRLPLERFQTRLVSRSSPYTDPLLLRLPGDQPATTFTYQTTEPRPAGTGSYLTTWQVKNDPSSRLQDPEGGVAIKRIDTLDTKGAVTGTFFAGTPALLVLPLPVTSGQSVESSSADTSTSANAMRFSGTVIGRERVDACGTILHSWAVEGTLATGAAPPAGVHVNVATQMGGLVIAWTIDGTFLSTTYRAASFRIGQPAPDR